MCGFPYVHSNASVQIHIDTADAIATVDPQRVVNLRKAPFDDSTKVLLDAGLTRGSAHEDYQA